jgi:nickel-dependent lactate racemase
MNISLLYGRNNLTVDLPDHTDVVSAPTLPAVPDETAALRDALRNPIGSAGLAQQVKRGDRVVVVHTDITRATPNDRIMPVLLAELEQAGVRCQDITLLNALGTHRLQTQAELRQMLGDAVVDNYRCLQHIGTDSANLVSLGVTARGHPVRINRLYMEADVRILTGFIEPHPFAGFSGGPKGVLPSIAGAESVQSNHGYDMISHPNATWGICEANPIWEEMREVALRAGPAFLLNVTLNPHRQITGVYAGDVLAAHAAGRAAVKAQMMVRVDAPYDIVITTNSGYPLDQNLYQTIKGISAASRITKEGGSIVVASACADGVPEHGGYMAILSRRNSPQEVLEMLAQPDFHEPDQWTVQIQSRVLLHTDVYIYSDGLTDEQIRRALYRPCRDVESLVGSLCARYGPGVRICAMPDGPQTIAYVG